MTTCVAVVAGRPCTYRAKYPDGRCGYHTTDPKTKAERQRRRRTAQNEHFIKHARPMNLTSVMRLSLREYLQLAMVAEELTGADR